MVAVFGSRIAQFGREGLSAHCANDPGLTHSCKYQHEDKLVKERISQKAFSTTLSSGKRVCQDILVKLLLLMERKQKFGST